MSHNADETAAVYEHFKTHDNEQTGKESGWIMNNTELSINHKLESLKLANCDFSKPFRFITDYDPEFPKILIRIVEM